MSEVADVVFVKVRSKIHQMYFGGSQQLFQGFVEVNEPPETHALDGHIVTSPARHYTKSSGIWRVTRQDALEDATRMRKACILMNQLP